MLRTLKGKLIEILKPDHDPTTILLIIGAIVLALFGIDGWFWLLVLAFINEEIL